MYDTNHDADGKTLVRCGGGFGRMGQSKTGSGGCVLLIDIEYLAEHYVKCCAEKIEKRNQCYGEQPRKCNVCGKIFPRKNFRKHLQTHAESQNLQCAKCPKKCRNNKLLASHVRTVHEGKHYLRSCSICGEGFRNNASLIKHQYRNHGKGDLNFSEPPL